MNASLELSQHRIHLQELLNENEALRLGLEPKTQQLIKRMSIILTALEAMHRFSMPDYRKANYPEVQFFLNQVQRMTSGKFAWDHERLRIPGEPDASLINGDPNG